MSLSSRNTKIASLDNAWAKGYSVTREDFRQRVDAVQSQIDGFFMPVMDKKWISECLGSSLYASMMTWIQKQIWALKADYRSFPFQHAPLRYVKKLEDLEEEADQLENRMKYKGVLKPDCCFQMIYGQFSPDGTMTAQTAYQQFVFKKLLWRRDPTLMMLTSDVADLTHMPTACVALCMAYVSEFIPVANGDGKYRDARKEGAKKAAATRKRKRDSKQKQTKSEESKDEMETVE